ncbi:MAG: SCO family protein [Chitinophagaceae bacterium]
MSKKGWFYIIFFAVLFIVFYTVITMTTDISKPKLPALNAVRPFRFLNQDGDTVSEKNVAGKVYLVEYFFTTCKGICPKMNHNMQELHDEMKSDDRFLILSHTVDPERDSVAALKHYADSLHAGENWWFLTGDKSSLYKTARESYILDDPQNSSKNISEQFLHTQLFALVDKDGMVRGIYDGLKKDDLALLREDIKTLLDQ